MTPEKQSSPKAGEGAAKGAGGLAPKMSPAAYGEILMATAPVSILPTSFSAKELVSRDAILLSGAPLDAGFEAAVTKSSVADSKRQFAVAAKIQVQVRQSGKLVVEISAEFEAEFHSEVEVTPEFVEIFQNTSVPMMVHPYFREIVETSMVRLGLPAIVLPLLVLPGSKG